MFLSKYVKGVLFCNKRYIKGVPFLSKWYKKRVEGWTSGRSLPILNFVKYPIPPPQGLDSINTVQKISYHVNQSYIKKHASSNSKDPEPDVGMLPNTDTNG